ncbi:uncharacterized protein LOC120790148 isoform X2 [Xiphias gladius]|uniref:uncharacterized protein LOC120790148 isoform X2 n=1 Tax=Xiphias gladius TaxID=8245 RepID=UPI001A999FA1|nr:uncharacterized protein LOC120790148 isoform X2 [Xiphias gladius]
MSALRRGGRSTCSGGDTSPASLSASSSLCLASRIRWQTSVGAVLLLLCGKLGWVELSRISRSAALPWIPASLLFVGNIYAGSRALSRIDIPFFFTLQNCSHVVSHVILRVAHGQKTQRLKSISICLLLLSAINLPLCDPKFDYGGYLWAVGHLLCVGGYRVFQVHYKPSNLSDLEQQCINYWFRGPRGCPGVPLPSVSHVSLRLLCQCTAGLFVAVGHSQTKKWTVPRALWDLEFFVQGHCHVPLPVYFLHGQQCSISDVVSGSPACLPACLPACRLPSLLHDVVVISHAGEALLVYSDREPQL